MDNEEVRKVLSDDTIKRLLLSAGYNFFYQTLEDNVKKSDCYDALDGLERTCNWLHEDITPIYKSILIKYIEYLKS